MKHWIHFNHGQKSTRGRKLFGLWIFVLATLMASGSLAAQEVALPDFGAEYGSGKDRETQRDNWRAFVEACAFALENGGAVALDSTLEIRQYPGENITLPKNAELIVRGADRAKSIVDVYPKTGVGPGSYGIFNVEEEGVNLTVENCQFWGPKHLLRYQTYQATLKWNGEDDVIRVDPEQEFWPELWERLEPGDTVFYTSDYTQKVGRVAVIKAINYDAKAFQTTEDLDAGGEVSDTVTHVAFYWPEDAPQADVRKYSRSWQEGNVENYFLKYQPGFDAYAIQGSINFNNCNLEGFETIVQRAGGWVDLNIQNSRLSALVTGVSYFEGEVADNLSKIMVDGLELTGCGFASDGGAVNEGNLSAGSPAIWGSGFYNHPNVGLEIRNAHIHDNTAGAFRNFSGRGAASKPADPSESARFEKVVFERNGEYSLLTSGVFPTEIINCQFLEYGNLELNFSADIIGTELGVDYFLSNSNPPAPEAAEVFVLNIQDCKIDDVQFTTSPWNAALLNKFRLEVRNCDYYLYPSSSQNANSFFGLGERDEMTRFDVAIKGGTIHFPDDGQPVDPSDNSIDADFIRSLVALGPNISGQVLIENIQLENDQDRVFAPVAIQSNWLNFGLRCIVRNCDLSPWRRLMNPLNMATAKHNVQLEGTPYFGDRPESMFYINALKAGSTSRAIDPQNRFYRDTVREQNLLIDDEYDTYLVEGDTLKTVSLYEFHLVNPNQNFHAGIANHRFRGQVKLVAEEKLRILPHGVDPASNIAGEDAITLYEGDSIVLQGVPDECLSRNPDAQITREVLIGTGDGARTVWELDQSTDAFKGEPVVPGSVRLVTDDGIELAADQEGFLQSEAVEGFINPFNDQGGWYLEFDTPPAAGSAIKKVYKAYENCSFQGYFKVVEVMPEEPLTLSVETNGPICAADQNGEIRLTPGGGFPPYNYDWREEGLEGSNPQELAAGDYQVTVTDSIGDTLTRDIIIEAKAPISTDTLYFDCYQDTSVAAVGMPEVFCGSLEFRTYQDEMVQTDCEKGIVAYINRQWEVGNAQDSVFNHLQTLAIRAINPENIHFPADRQYDCGNANILPERTGRPRIEGEILRTGGLCGVEITYEDDTLSTCLPGGLEVVRTWTVKNNCTGLSRIEDQKIVIRDEKAPEIVCPDPLVVGTDPGKCYATVTLPKPEISDQCDAQPYFLVSSSFGGVGVGPHEFVPTGEHVIEYTAVDACGNTKTCYTTLTVKDDEAPTPVCANNSVVTVNEDGIARVKAASLDNGSTDNCKDTLFFKLQRLDGGSCEAGNGENTAYYQDETVFCCQDVGKTIPVSLRVYELDPGSGAVAADLTELEGHYSECVIQVEVQDNRSPLIACVEDKVADCSEDLSDLSRFGRPVFKKDCGLSIDSSRVDQIDACGTGEIIRTWTATDGSGNQSSCSQRIQVVNNDQLTEKEIKWPEDIVLQSCGADTDPANLPTNSARPVVEHQSCSRVGVSYKDQVFEIAHPACIEILRTWEVVDLCKYDPKDPNSEGRFTFVQTIQIEDNESPVLQIPGDTVVSLQEDCGTVLVDLPLAAAEDCNPNVRITNFSPFAESDGSNASGRYPLGTTTVQFRAVDGCGNETLGSMAVTVLDEKAPVPVCNGGLTVNLAATETGNTVTVQAESFDAGSTDPCGGDDQLQMTIRRLSEESTGTPTTNELTFTCEDIGVQAIEFWVTDKHGNSDFCVTYLLVQDNNGVCESSQEDTPTGMVAGEILTEEGQEVEEVTVDVVSQNPFFAVTGANGYFEFLNLPFGNGYQIVPQKDQEALNGISTLDLVLIARHILGIQTFDSPYKHIAADVNRSGHISTLDIIHLRRMLLNGQQIMPNNTSWRFIPANYSFRNPDAPLREDFPEAYRIDELTDEEMYTDFVGLKVGDVNASAKANSHGFVQSRSRRTQLPLQIRERSLQRGKEVTIDLYVAPEERLGGMQMTFGFDLRMLEFIDLQAGELEGMGEHNFGLQYLEDGLITMSWNGEWNSDSQDDLRVLTMTFRARQTGKLSEAVYLGQRLLPGEAYDQNLEIKDLALHFSSPESGTLQQAKAKLEQNQPNPFSDRTTIAFELRREGSVSLSVFDAAGRKVMQLERYLQAGHHRIPVAGNQLPHSGLYFYRLQTNGFSKTKKMMYQAR